MSRHTGGPSTRGAWLRRYGAASTTAEATLVCLPHAGGAPTFFRDWPGLFSPALEVVSVCYPGRQDRFDEPCITDMAEMAEEVAAALAPLADRPLAVFGHSMGAAVGYEAARLLRVRHGIRLSYLCVSGMVPPHRVPRGTRHLAGDEALAADILEQGGTDARMLADEELRAFVMPAIRADYQLMETYRHVPGEVLDTPIVAYYGRQDADTTAAVMREWQRCTRATAETRSFPGGHFYLQQVQKALADDIGQRVLASVCGARAAGPARISQR
jgi:pyochelin biosynthetic protein PchC